MLGFIFGFNARLGRLHYFLSTIALAVVMTAICVAVALSISDRAPRGIPLTFDAIKWPVLLVAGLFLLASLMLQCMRIRDIGWDPVCVIPGWIAIQIFDTVIVGKFPALAMSPEHHGTAVGALVNLALFLAMMFWPGGDYDDSAPPLGEPYSPNPSPRNTGSIAAERLARASGEFGRRAF